MTSNLSSCKILKEEYKKYIGLISLAIVFYIFVKLVPALLEYSYYYDYDYSSKDYIEIYRINYYLTTGNIFNKLITIVLAIVVGSIVFSYLHNRKKVDFYHSLPISRNRLFLTKYSLGIFIVIPIIVIIQLLSYIVLKIILKEYALAFEQVFYSLIFDIIFFIVIYTFTVFSNILAGNTTIGVLLSLILINLPVIVSNILSYLVNIFFINVYYITFLSFIADYSPMEYYTSTSSIEIKALIFYIIIDIIMIIISMYLFKIRKSEKSGVCIAFKYAKSILKYIGVCISAILMGIIFFTIPYEMPALYFSIILGSIIFHCIAEIVYNFDFKAIFKNWYSIIACAVISILVVIVFQYDIFKIQQYVPDTSDVKSIVVSSDIILESEENIDTIVSMHEISVENTIKNPSDDNIFIGDLYITYNQKNNYIVRRNINIYEKDLDLIKQLVNNEEYIQKILPFLYDYSLISNDFELLISNNAQDEIYLTNKQEIFGLLDALKEDITQNGLYGDNDNALFYIDTPFASLNVFATYTNTIEYIEQLGFAKRNLNSEDISYVYFYYPEYTEITDKEIIAKLLEDYVIASIYEYDYNLNFVYYYTDDYLYAVDKNKYIYCIYIKKDILKELNLIE